MKLRLKGWRMAETSPEEDFGAYFRALQEADLAERRENSALVIHRTAARCVGLAELLARASSDFRMGVDWPAVRRHATACEHCGTELHGHVYGL